MLTYLSFTILMYKQHTFKQILQDIHSTKIHEKKFKIRRNIYILLTYFFFIYMLFALVKIFDYLYMYTYIATHIKHSSTK